jgi:hypothetical protein
MESVNPALKGIKPPITFAQANAIARQADALEGKSGIGNAWATAIASFKKSHVVKDGKWVKKEGSEYGKRKELHGSVKALEIGGTRYLVLYTTNAFRDRQLELFSTKSLEDYVKRVDRTGDRGRIWFWHVKGSDFGDIIWQAVSGRILVELVRVDDTPHGDKMYHAVTHPEDHPSLLPQGWKTSHGFVYLPWTKDDDGVYHFMHKYESTALPAHRACNLFTSLSEVRNMAKVTKEKREALAELVGEDNAKAIIEDAEELTKALEGAGVEFKEEKVEEGESEDEEMEEEESDEEEEGKKEEASDRVMEIEMDEDLMKEIAQHVDVSGPVSTAVEQALKEMLPKALDGLFGELKTAIEGSVKETVQQASLDSAESIVQQAISGTLRLKPFTASKDNGNVIPADEKEQFEEEQKARKTDKEPADPVARVVQGMLS